MQHQDDLLAGADVILGDEILNQIDQVVAPGAERHSIPESFWNWTEKRYQCPLVSITPRPGRWLIPARRTGR